MRMLEHVLLRYADEALNGFCYVNILFRYFILFLGIDNQKSDWGPGGLSRHARRNRYLPRNRQQCSAFVSHQLQS